MTRLQVANLFRILGYITGIACLAYFFLTMDSFGDGSSISEEERAAQNKNTYVVIIGCSLGLACAMLGAFLRMWPESQASIRRRANEENTSDQKEKRD